MATASGSSGSSQLSALSSAIGNFLLVLGVGMALVAFVYPDGSLPFAKPGTPVSLSVPGLKVKAPVVPIQVTGAELDPPRDYLQVGWWDASAKPGSHQGQTVITGHTVHTGGGSMDDIGRLGSGQKVDVKTSEGTMRYRVESVEVLSKAALASHAQQIFGQGHGDGRLVLITCTDWNGSYYESNVVVYGTPVGDPTAGKNA